MCLGHQLLKMFPTSDWNRDNSVFHIIPRGIEVLQIIFRQHLINCYSSETTEYIILAKDEFHEEQVTGDTTDKYAQCIQKTRK